MSHSWDALCLTKPSSEHIQLAIQNAMQTSDLDKPENDTGLDSLTQCSCTDAKFLTKSEIPEATVGPPSAKDSEGLLLH